MSRLIFAHDLHGIDIDATQIAALALWLPCQRADREMELEQDRPGITRSNIGCAEPMPGEKSLLDEFLKTRKENRLENLMRCRYRCGWSGGVAAWRHGEHDGLDSFCDSVLELSAKGQAD